MALETQIARSFRGSSKSDLRRSTGAADEAARKTSRTTLAVSKLYFRLATGKNLVGTSLASGRRRRLSRHAIKCTAPRHIENIVTVDRREAVGHLSAVLGWSRLMD